MKTTHDWLPFNHEALYDQANQTWNYLLDASNRDRMGFTPGTPQGQWLDMDFAQKFFSFTAAFDAWRDPATHTPFRLTFEGDQRGKTMYYALRWENTTGEKGPWNEIQSAIIP